MSKSEDRRKAEEGDIESAVRYARDSSSGGNYNRGDQLVRRHGQSARNEYAARIREIVNKKAAGEPDTPQKLEKGSRNTDAPPAHELGVTAQNESPLRRAIGDLFGEG